MWNMTCTTLIKCPVQVLHICRYTDAKTGNVELIPINTNCGRIICKPGKASPPTTPLIPATLAVRNPRPRVLATKPAVVGRVGDGGLYEFSMSSFIM